MIKSAYKSLNLITLLKSAEKVLKFATDVLENDRMTD
jgi:hypothetical protein